MPVGSPLTRQKAEAMQRNVVTTAKRQLPDVTANYLLSSLISGNAAPPPPLKWGGTRLQQRSGFDAELADSTASPSRGAWGPLGLTSRVTHSP